MGDRTPPRSFNTVKHSNRIQRLKRQRRANLALVAICIVVIAILLSSLVLLVCSIVDVFGNKDPATPDDGNQPNNDQSVQSITFTQITQANTAIHTGELIVVNKTNAYVFPTGNTGLLNIYDNRTKVNGTNPYQISFITDQLHKDAFNAFQSMILKYYELSEGDNSVLITSAYRSYADQEKLNSSIQAGYSDHHTGYCVTLQQSTFSEAGSRQKLDADHWIYQNCEKYGFIVRYPDNKVAETGVSDYNYCFRYVGIPHATYIGANGLCLEEYVELLKTAYTASSMLKITTSDGNLYGVYYVAAQNGELSTVSVPANYKYTVSGDNMSGFIITVNLSAPNV